MGHKSKGKRRVRNLQHRPRNEVSKIFIISLSWNRARKNKVLDLERRTVEYGPLNWPIEARVLSKKNNKKLYLPPVAEGEGDLPYKKAPDVHWKFKIKSLKETELDADKALCDPKRHKKY